MIGAGEITPGFIGETVDEEAVVDRIRMFVEKDERVRWFADVCGFEKLNVFRIESVGKFAGVTHHCVHGHAANARTVRGGRFVRRALVNRGRAIGVRTQFGVGQINEVGIIVVGGPVFDVIGSGLAVGGRFGLAVVIDDEVLVII